MALLIVNQSGDMIYNAEKFNRIIREGKSIYGDMNAVLYTNDNAAVVFEAIIEAAATGATLIRLDKNI